MDVPLSLTSVALPRVVVIKVLVERGSMDNSQRLSIRLTQSSTFARGTAGKVSAVPFRVMAVLTQKLATPPLRLLESQSRYCTCGLVERQIRESHAWAALGSRTALHTTPQIQQNSSIFESQSTPVLRW